MALAEEKNLLTSEEYLAYERQAQAKSEYFAGEVFAMAGASEAHNLITLNIAAELRQQLKQKPCRVYSNDMRVLVSHLGLYAYPDVVVTCGERHFSDEHKDTLINPTFIVEVLSPSTADYDRGGKFAVYRNLPSLQTYMLVAQDHCHVEVFERQVNDSWLLTEFKDVETILSLPSLGVQLSLAEVYSRLELEI